MVKKTVKFNKGGIEKLPKDEAVVYKIQTPGGKTNYAGVAKRGRVHERLREHLVTGQDTIPGSKVRIEQMSNITDAKSKEARIISRSKPKYNEKGK